MIKNILTESKVHCITNYVSAREVINALYAIGARGYVGDDPDEVKDITEYCDSLLINIGTLNFRTIRSMLKAGLYANQLRRPIILQPQAIETSTLRKNTIQTFLNELHVDIIIGDICEIKEVYSLVSNRAVEEGKITVEQMADIIAERKKCTVIIMDIDDYVTNGKESYTCKNRTGLLTTVFGYKCVYAAVAAAVVGTGLDAYKAAKWATLLMRAAREKTEEKLSAMDLGIGAFDEILINSLAKIDSIIGLLDEYRDK